MTLCTAVNMCGTVCHIQSESVSQIESAVKFKPTLVCIASDVVDLVSNILIVLTMFLMKLLIPQLTQALLQLL